MNGLNLRWAETAGIDRFERALEALGSRKTRTVANRVVNRTGDMARAQVRRKLAEQTGLKRKTIVAAVKIRRSVPANLTYRMTARGGDIALKFFGARETRAGVSASPFGKRQVFPGTFIRGGRFPNRVDLSMGGHVFQRIGGSRFPIDKVRSGVIIPAEMVKGETAAAFKDTTARVMPRRMQHEISRATGGVFS